MNNTKKMPYSIVFLSSGDIAAPVFEELIKNVDFSVKALICQPNKAQGREKVMKKSLIQLIAERNEIKIFQPENISSDNDLLKIIKEIKPDFLITFAYGQILNKEWLEVSSIAAINIHASILPKYRGASPIQAAILNGDRETGISIMKMEEKMDAGPVYFIHKIKINENIFAYMLHDELANLARDIIPDDLKKIAETPHSFKAQNDNEATYCKKIKREDGFLDFQSNASTIMSMFRAYNPWPGIYTTFRGKRLKLLDIEIESDIIPPGYVVCDEDKLKIGTMDGCISVKQLQIESKQSLHHNVFIIGQQDFCNRYLPS